MFLLSSCPKDLPIIIILNKVCFHNERQNSVFQVMLAFNVTCTNETNKEPLLLKCYHRVLYSVESNFSMDFSWVQCRFIIWGTMNFLKIYKNNLI